MKTARQLALPLSTPRPKRRYARTGTPHRVRPAHCHRHPVHITLRRAGLLPSLREPILFSALRRALGRAARSWFRVIHFSLQSNHAHMIVEASDTSSLSRGMTGLTVRLARAVNRVLGRRGRLWSGRYHCRALATPREVRNALVYVLLNRRKHAAPTAVVQAFDVCSSAWWFTGWAEPPSCGPPIPTELCPVVPPQTWLARTGWKRHGLIRRDESPARDNQT